MTTEKLTALLGREFRLLVIISLAVLMIGISACGSDSEMEMKIPPIEGYTLEWSDEFSGNAIDLDNWGFETGDGTDYGLAAGWGNNELQIYTSEEGNASIVKDDGLSVLSITALDDGAGGYTSAKLTTKNKVSIRFGRIDVKAKLPEGQGLWPAIWMLGDNKDEVDWPGCGEIDIMEILGNDPSTYYSTLHYVDGGYRKGETQENYTLPSGLFSEDYHVFSIEWTDTELMFSVDGSQISTIAIEEDMKEFQRSFYMILNVAVGGYWPGFPDNTTSFPQSMLVDYVRVYSKDDFTAPAVPALVISDETLGGDIPENIGDLALQDDFIGLVNADVIAFGGGGEPNISSSNIAINGEESLLFNFPGGKWGGAYLEMETGVDVSSHSNFRFSLNIPSTLNDVEIKLESPTSNAAIFLVNYTPGSASNGFVEYIIPLTDFEGLDLTNIHIPFSMWNPKDDEGNFVGGIVLIDNIYFD